MEVQVDQTRCHDAACCVDDDAVVDVVVLGDKAIAVDEDVCVLETLAIEHAAIGDPHVKPLGSVRGHCPLEYKNRIGFKKPILPV